MKAYIKSGHSYRTNKPNGGDFDLQKYVGEVLTRFGIPYVDPCCPAKNDLAGALQSVRWNPTTPGLERYDQVTNAWVAIVNAA